MATRHYSATTSSANPTTVLVSITSVNLTDAFIVSGGVSGSFNNSLMIYSFTNSSTVSVTFNSVSDNSVKTAVFTVVSDLASQTTWP